jgi:hypothetical protein
MENTLLDVSIEKERSMFTLLPEADVVQHSTEVLRPPNRLLIQIGWSKISRELSTTEIGSREALPFRYPPLEHGDVFRDRIATFILVIAPRPDPWLIRSRCQDRSRVNAVADISKGKSVSLSSVLPLRPFASGRVDQVGFHRGWVRHPSLDCARRDLSLNLIPPDAEE